MKTWSLQSLLTAGICVVMLTGYHLIFNSNKTSDYAPQSALPVKMAAYHGVVDATQGDFTAAAARAMPAVVHIKSIQTIQTVDPWSDFWGWGGGFGGGKRSSESTGSGVILDKEGYIVTNNHVIGNAEQITVTLYDNRTFTAKVIGTDPSADLGVLKIEADHLTPIEFLNSDQVQVGQWAVAVGNPFNLSSTVTAGIISAMGRNLEIIKDQAAIESFIQTDAAVNPGNSGGALVDVDGRLIGVNTAISSPTGAYSGYAFAIPSNLVQKIVADLIQFGTVQRAYLGLGKITVLNNIEAEKNDIDIQEGILIQSLNMKGSAAQAGIEIGDIITEIDGQPIKSEAKLTESVARHRPGDKINMKVYRDGKYETLNVLLKNQQGTTAVVRRDPKLQELGIDLESLDARTRKQYSIDNGVKVTRLYAGKIRQSTNMQEGFVILEINGTKVSTPDEVTHLLEDLTGAVTIDGFIPNYYVNGRPYTNRYKVEL